MMAAAHGLRSAVGLIAEEELCRRKLSVMTRLTQEYEAHDCSKTWVLWIAGWGGYIRGTFSTAHQLVL
jgi:hypothetical protein